MFVLVGCSSAAKPPSKVAEPVLEEIAWSAPLPPLGSERITADVSVFGVQAGAFDFEMTPSCRKGMRYAALKSKLSTVGVVRLLRTTDGVAETTMDLERGRPLRSELVIVDGAVTSRYQATHRAGAVETTFERTGDRVERKVKRIASGEHALDLQSAFLLLRYWRAEPGDIGYFYVLLGKSLWYVTAHYHGVQLMQDEERPALHLTGLARRLPRPKDEADTTRRFSLWLAADDTRTPLRVEGDASFGKVLMSLGERSVERDADRPCAEPALVEPSEPPAGAEAR